MIYGPNSTVCMIRPGTSVNSPASTSAPANTDIIVIALGNGAPVAAREENHLPGVIPFLARKMRPK
jgi:hypothetical protein